MNALLTMHVADSTNELSKDPLDFLDRKWAVVKQVVV